MNEALAAFVARLKMGPVLPRPEAETWKQTVARISTEGVTAQVTRDVYVYFRDVLPPHWMDGPAFCFAEGSEAFRLFWFESGSGDFLAKQLSWGETVTFCRLADISLPS